MGLGSSDDERMMRGREPLENMNLHKRATVVRLLLCRQKADSITHDKARAIFSHKQLQNGGRLSITA